jgi:hypothetical protein
MVTTGILGISRLRRRVRSGCARDDRGGRHRRDRRHHRDRNVKSNHPFDFAQGRLQTRRNAKGFWRKCLASAFTLQIILGVPLLPSRALRLARNDRGREDRRHRRHRATSPRASSRVIVAITGKEKQIPRSARNDNPGNILRQTGTDNSVYDQGQNFKLKFTCIFL